MSVEDALNCIVHGDMRYSHLHIDRKRFFRSLVIYSDCYMFTKFNHVPMDVRIDMNRAPSHIWLTMRVMKARDAVGGKLCYGFGWQCLLGSLLTGQVTTEEQLLQFTPRIEEIISLHLSLHGHIENFIEDQLDLDLTKVRGITGDQYFDGLAEYV